MWSHILGVCPPSKIQENRKANRDDVATTGTAENLKKKKKSDSFLHSTQNYGNIAMVLKMLLSVL